MFDVVRALTLRENFLNCANEENVESVVALSAVKAVRPINEMNENCHSDLKYNNFLI